MKPVQGAALATAVAAMFASVGCASATEDPTPVTKAQPVECQGINECKGKGECMTTGKDAHGCAGVNECKGTAWIQVPSAKECTDRGGSVIVHSK